MQRASSFEQVGAGVARFRDTCNVYVLVGREAVLVDFGSGRVLDHLAELGVEQVTDVLVTHHHRDQVQGLARPRTAGDPHLGAAARARPDRRGRRALADPAARQRLRPAQDRFSLLESVPVDGTVPSTGARRYGGVEVYALPTPGHTVGSVTYLVERDGRRLAFSGDLVHGDGKVWSLAATQWSYSGTEGLAATFFSCGVLAGREPDLLLPSHGEPVEEPAARWRGRASAIEELATMRLEEPWRLADMQATTRGRAITPHLLRNRT